MRDFMGTLAQSGQRTTQVERSSVAGSRPGASSEDGRPRVGSNPTGARSFWSLRPPPFSWFWDVVFPLLGASLLILALTFCSGEPARAHSFYPFECCHDQDCWPTGEGAREPDPEFTREGWRLASGEVIPFNQARPSPDGRFHVCRRGGAPDGALIRPQSTAPCLWVPQGGV